MFATVSRKHRRCISVAALNLGTASRVIENHVNSSLPHISENPGSSVNYSYHWARPSEMTRNSALTVRDSGFSSRRSSQIAPTTSSQFPIKYHIQSKRFNTAARRIKKISTTAPIRNLSVSILISFILYITSERLQNC